MSDLTEGPIRALALSRWAAEVAAELTADAEIDDRAGSPGASRTEVQ